MSALVIQELTGSQRSITLRGWALPQRGPDFGGRLRTKTTWYAGNKVGTLQVLGPEVTPTEFEGYWMDRHLGDPDEGQQIVTEGFDTVELAVDLVAAFESIRDSGNRLRVEWGPFVRNGVLAEFTPRPERTNDIKWKMSFEWDARDDATQPRATTDEPPDTAELRERQNGSDDQQAFAPKQTDPDFFAEVAERAAEVRRRTGDVFDKVREAQGAAVIPIRSIRGIVTDVEAMRTEANGLLVHLVESFTDEVTSFDDLFSTLAVEGWRRTQARRVSDLRAQAQLTARQVRTTGQPEPVRIVETREGDTLRRIAWKVYGVSDEWQRIAAANGLTDSLVPVGLMLVIPPLGAPVDTQGC
jgi:nucleoid-associated protein YgaU